MSRSFGMHIPLPPHLYTIPPLPRLLRLPHLHLLWYKHVQHERHHIQHSPLLDTRSWGMSARGIIFRRSIRASYATLDIVAQGLDRSGNNEPDDDPSHAVIVVQFSRQEGEVDSCEGSDATNAAAVCRSYFRRTFKLGSEVKVDGGRWLQGPTEDDATVLQKLVLVGFSPPRLGWLEETKEDVDTSALQELEFGSSDAESHSDGVRGIRLLRRQVWDHIRCQRERTKYYPAVGRSRGPAGNDALQHNSSLKKQNADGKRKARHGVVCKRRQGEIVADFVIRQMMQNGEGDGDATSENDVINYLNLGSGVIDVAGGSGHVSLALGLRGVRSTVVDPRPSVGRLPSKDRKAMRKVIKQHEQHSRNGEENVVSGVIVPPPPPVPFSSLRAWFGSKPVGVDTAYREGMWNDNNSVAKTDALDIPICSMCSPDRLLPTCRAIVALHPDEATGDIVEFAVKHQIPFVVVPCCVFSRLFPDRLKPGTREIVATYDDLIEWLVDKDPSIRLSTLPFDGSNKAVWSMFSSNV